MEWKKRSTSGAIGAAPLTGVWQRERPSFSCSGP